MKFLRSVERPRWPRRWENFVWPLIFGKWLLSGRKKWILGFLQPEELWERFRVGVGFITIRAQPQITAGDESD